MSNKCFITTTSGKTFAKDSIYTVLDVQIGHVPFAEKKVVEKKGYFAGTLDELRKIVDKGELGYLTTIECKRSQPFRDNHFHYYTFFLPEDKVHPAPPKEKKYRPFKTFEEFTSTVTPWDLQFIGRCVHLREKNNPENQLHVKPTGFGVTSKGLNCIVLGNFSYTPENLFKYFEFKDADNTWHQLGIEITEESE